MWRAGSLSISEKPQTGSERASIHQNLRKEVSDGLDLSLRHQGGRFRADVNFFYYGIKTFVFLLPTGQIDEDTGFGGIDYVRAELRTGVNLPRIPPLRGRLGLDAHFHSLDVRPELILAHAQNRVFTNETRTPGYGVFNVAGSYTWTTRHFANIFAVNGFNLTNKFYINHVSFIKDFSPEIGRGVRATYTLRIF